jgi:hypothetical protein
VALTVLSVSDGDNSCIVSATGSDATTLDGLPLPSSPTGEIGDANGLWARPLGGGKYIIPVEAARQLGQYPKASPTPNW